MEFCFKKFILDEIIQGPGASGGAGLNFWKPASPQIKGTPTTGAQEKLKASSFNVSSKLTGVNPQRQPSPMSSAMKFPEQPLKSSPFVPSGMTQPKIVPPNPFMPKNR